ncbi:hypothetical protein BVRB_8g182460 [Beta vulgaris subsp. vulgaris]|nr:hypothetical protein BVRB_8g182460 [Beta vulgaris subsp. vulgaris]
MLRPEIFISKEILERNSAKISTLAPPYPYCVSIIAVIAKDVKVLVHKLLSIL